MGKIAIKNQPCISPDCESSDAMQIYEDGTATCFSCNEYFKADQVKAARSGDEFVVVETVTKKPSPILKKKSVSLEEIEEFHSRGFADRGITKPVCEFFGVKVSYDINGEIDTHYYPYGEGSYKVRKLPKEFFWIGKAGSIFGHDKFSPGGKRLIICEGEVDALSVAQASIKRYDKIYPVIALPGASYADHLLEIRDWIRTFDEVVILMDNDKAGKEAQDRVLKIVGIDKARLPTYPEDCKDANDVLVKFGAQALNQMIWDCHTYTPVGVLRRDALWEALEKYNDIESIPYPPCLAGINTKLKGKRPGEIVLFVSGTGSGKSTLLREDMLYNLENTNARIGILSLEESPAETTRKLAGMALSKNPALQDIPLEELKIGFDKVFGDDRVLLLDHQGSMNDDNLIDKLEYLALMGCEYIYIDHITILVSEGADGLTGNEAIDKVMNDLLRLVKRHPVWIGLVSHLRKVPTAGGKSFEEGRLPSLDDIRGSGSIKQICFDIIAFARNLTAEDETVRNTIKMRVLKARYTGLTGDVAGAVYNNETGRLTSLQHLGENEEDSFKLL